MRPLLTIEQAARELNVPQASLKSAAQTHGMLIRMGRAVRIDPNTLPELIKRCQEKPKDRASTGVEINKSGSSEIQDGQTFRRAQATAEILKKGSRRT